MKMKAIAESTAGPHSPAGCIKTTLNPASTSVLHSQPLVLQLPLTPLQTYMLKPPTTAGVLYKTRAVYYQKESLIHLLQQQCQMRLLLQ